MGNVDLTAAESVLLRGKSVLEKAERAKAALTEKRVRVDMSRAELDKIKAELAAKGITFENSEQLGYIINQRLQPFLQTLEIAEKKLQEAGL